MDDARDRGRDIAEPYLIQARRQLAWCHTMLSRPECRPGNPLWNEVMATISRASRNLCGMDLVDAEYVPPPLGLVGYAPDCFHPDGDDAVRSAGLGRRNAPEVCP